jgi:hypothetical protein
MTCSFDNGAHLIFAALLCLIGMVFFQPVTLAVNETGNWVPFYTECVGIARPILHIGMSAG